MAHAQKPDFVFPRNGLVHLNRYLSSVQSTAGSRGVRIRLSNAGYTTFWGGVRVLYTHSIRQFPLHFPSRASPCTTRFRISYTMCKLSWLFFISLMSRNRAPETLCTHIRWSDNIYLMINKSPRAAGGAEFLEASGTVRGRLECRMMLLNGCDPVFGGSVLDSG